MAKTFNDIIRLGDGATGSFATIDIQQIRGTATQIDDFNSASLALIGAGRTDSNPSAEQGVGKRALGHIVATSGSLTESPRYYVYHNSSSGDINLSGSEWTTLTNWKEIALETTDVTFNQITSSGNISASGNLIGSSLIIDGITFASSDIGGAADYSELSNIPSDIISSSEQVASDISGSWLGYLTGSGIFSQSSQLGSSISGSWLGYLTGSNIVSQSSQLGSSISGSWLGYLTGSNIYSHSEQILGSITSSGDISSSQTLFANHISASGDISASVIKAEFFEITSSVLITSESTEFGNSADDTHHFSGSITASGDISSSGTISANTYVGVVSESGQLSTDISGSWLGYLTSSNIVSQSSQLGSSISGSWLGYLTGSGIFSQSSQLGSSISGSWLGYLTGSNIVSESSQLGSSISGSWLGYLTGSNIVSQSSQIASDISGSWLGYLTGSNIVSESSQLGSSISGSWLGYLTGSNIVSESSQIGSSISGSWLGYLTGSGILSQSSQLRLLEFTNITASGNISGSATSSVSAGTGSFGVIQVGEGLFSSASLVSEPGFPFSGSALITGSLIISGGDTNSTTLEVDGKVSSSNFNVGVPTSNNWKENLNGSYFNNFNASTDTSEILRFMAGVLSHSLDVADASPNTKTFNSIDTNENNLGSTDSIAAYIPQNYTSIDNATLTYLGTKGFANAGQRIFEGLIVYHDNATTYKIDMDSNSGGSTTVRSSTDTQLFGLGLLDSGGAEDFKVRVIATQSFSDNSSVTAPNTATGVHSTSSLLDLTQPSFGTSNGLTLAKIETNQPAVIPAAYQDGKFINVGGTSMPGTLTRKYHSSKTSFTSVSSSGYYRFHGIKVGIASGSSEYDFKSGNTVNKFWAPIDQIETNLGNNSISDSGATSQALTATSRSLSGAPYLRDADYQVSMKITGLFNPLYRASTTLVDMEGNSVGVGTLTIGGGTVSTNGGTIQTSNKVFETDGTVVNTGTVPRYDDEVLITGSLSFNWTSAGSENINQTGTSDSSFQVLTKVRNRSNTQSTIDTRTINYHTAGTFGQPVSSGSLAIYGRAQGYDNGTLTGTSETFKGENFRIKVDNNVTTFAGNYFTTASFQTNDEGDAVIGVKDLQVKPGFLVNPGGAYRYWFAENFGNTYKYYIRKFKISSGTKSQLTINIGKTLVAWNSTNLNQVAVGIIFKSSTSAGSNTSISTCRLYDPTNRAQNLIESNISNDNFKNPFSSNIDLYGNKDAPAPSGTTYYVPIRNLDGMFLDSATGDDEFYVIIRYKGDPTPVSTITLGYS